jgi:hypothetical protein
VNSLHPLFLDHAWVAGTGPIEEFNAAVTTALRIGLPSLVVEGPPGVGKTAALRDLFDALALDTKIVPWRASAVDIRTRADTPRFYRSFQRAPGATNRAATRLTVLSDQESTVNSILLSCSEAQTQRVMLFIDEAQQLQYPTLVSLKDTMEQLLARRVHMLVMLLAEPDIKDKVGRLMNEPGGNSLAQRFFASMHHYRGLHPADLTTLMEHVDRARWPEREGPTYTEFFVPKLFRAGWRLQEQAQFLWDEFHRTADGMGLDVTKFELLPRFAVRAIRFALPELQRDVGQAKDLGTLMANAVANSGFADAHRLQPQAVYGPDKSAPRRRGSRR